MQTSYNKSDVEFLLTDLTGTLEPLEAEEREKAIVSGIHYSRMLPAEHLPSECEVDSWRKLVKETAPQIARLVQVVGDGIIHMYSDRSTIVLISLVRAGTPAGILLKHYLSKFFYKVDHFSISIIKGFGIDEAALNEIHRRYADDAKEPAYVFVDGWTGKGSIREELLSSVLQDSPMYPVKLAVLADPAGVADFYGTRDDVMIPTCCFNSIVTGLISRSLLNDDIVAEKKYHGAVYFKEFEEHDLSNEFIDAIDTELFSDYIYTPHATVAAREVSSVCKQFGVTKRYVRPGFGEATRVLLRKVPKVLLINRKLISDAAYNFLKRLADDKNVPIQDDASLQVYAVYGIMEVVNCEE